MIREKDNMEDKEKEDGEPQIKAMPDGDFAIKEQKKKLMTNFESGCKKKGQNAF